MKIYVDHEGWYHITQPQLVAAGLNPVVNPNTLHLYAEGVEQPIQITGRLNLLRSTSRDRVLRHRHRHALLRTARLLARLRRAAGTENLRRSARGIVRARKPQSFIQTVELKDRTTYFAALLTR